MLAEALQKFPEPVRQRFIDHLREGTSADYLAEWLSRAGTPVSATTIKRARSRLNV